MTTPRHFLAAALVALLCAALAPQARAFTPESPEVKKILEKAFAYLEKSGAHDQLGGQCLVGLCFFKRDGNPDHPRVQIAIKACLQTCQPEPKQIVQSLYSVGIALIFLCEVDPSKYRPEIEKLLAVLDLQQKEHGGWGYLGGPHATTGDTSMTQYAVLGTWTAVRTNVVPLPKENIENVCNWLIRTQDPSGGWGYQGKDPGPGKGREKQEEIRPSLSAAGLGSTLMCADLLHFVHVSDPDEARLEGLPAAVKVKKEEKKEPALTDKVDKNQIANAIRAGNGWFAANYTIKTPAWNFYYLYGLERYQSFRELVEGKIVKEPKWYNDGVVFLRDAQDEDGSFGKGDAGPVPNTSFAILFLLRSTKKTIEKTVHLAAEGTLVGGRGLPGDTSNLQIRGGRVVSTTSQEADKLLAALADDDESDGDEVLEASESIVLSDKPEVRKQQVEQVAQLATSTRRAVRLAAIKVLARARSFPHASILIDAVNDADPEISMAAHVGLRQLSRKLGGIELRDGATTAERQATTAQWRAWYKSVNPSGE